MKFLFGITAIAFLFTFNACKKGDSQEAQTGDAKDTVQTDGVTLKIDQKLSILGWTGFKPAGKHNGTVMIEDGEFKINGTEVVGGSFTIKMDSIDVKDLNAETGRDKLAGHLKSEDFFDVKKYPTAKFVITKVTSKKSDSTTHEVEGNLTLRGVEKGITFPAHILASKSGVTAKAKFKIDRTNWGVMYHSAKDSKLSDIEKKAKDKIISDEIEIELNLTSAS